MTHRWLAPTLAAVVAVAIIRRRPSSSTLESRVSDDEYALDMLKEEYADLRQEISTGLQAQQVILQWSLAGFGTIFAAALFSATQDAVDVTNGSAAAAFLVTFGLALPGLTFAAYLVWTGELIRVERAGRYLRGMDKFLATTLTLTHPAVADGPHRWETFTLRGAALKNGLARVSSRSAISVDSGYISALLCFRSASSLERYLLIHSSITTARGPWLPPVMQ